MSVDAAVVSEIVRRVLREQGGAVADAPQTVPVGVSNRHIHLTPEHVEILFGKGYELTPLKDLSQPGQYACKELLTIIGPSLRPIENVRVLGPVRKKTQVEISRTDSFTLKVKPPVRESGDTAGSAGLTIVGPKGVVAIEEGCIIANRHIHMSPPTGRPSAWGTGTTSPWRPTARAAPGFTTCRSGFIPSSAWKCTSTPTTPTPPVSATGRRCGF